VGFHSQEVLAAYLKVHCVHLAGQLGDDTYTECSKKGDSVSNLFLFAVYHIKTLVDIHGLTFMLLTAT
jgi:hypothetical protein